MIFVLLEALVSELSDALAAETGCAYLATITPRLVDGHEAVELLFQPVSKEDAVKMNQSGVPHRTFFQKL